MISTFLKAFEFNFDVIFQFLILCSNFKFVLAKKKIWNWNKKLEIEWMMLKLNSKALKIIQNTWNYYFFDENEFKFWNLIIVLWTAAFLWLRPSHPSPNFNFINKMKNHKIKFQFTEKIQFWCIWNYFHARKFALTLIFSSLHFLLHSQFV